MDPTRLTSTLNEARAIIGGVQDTCDFVVEQLKHAGVNIKEDAPLCYSFQFLDLPNELRHYFDKVRAKNGLIRISFASPTPKHYTYIGRNHIFVEDLSRGVVNDSINGGTLAAGRAMVMETEDVKQKVTVLLMRVRSVIRDKQQTDRELVGEEMIFIGYRGNIEKHDYLTKEECQMLFLEAKASGSLDLLTQKQLLTRSIAWINDEKELRSHTDEIALERAAHLVESFTMYRTYLEAKEYQVVEPVLPMDVIAAYVFIPKI
jgi:hypothetical protein